MPDDTKANEPVFWHTRLVDDGLDDFCFDCRSVWDWHLVQNHVNKSL